MSNPSQIALAPIAAKDQSSDRDVLTAAKGGGILFFGRVFDYASRFVFGIIIARAIGASGYGLYGLGDTIVSTLSVLALLGLPAGIVRFLPVALGERDENRVWGIIQVVVALVAIISLGLGLMLFGLAGWAAEHLFHEQSVAPVLRIFSAAVPLLAIAKILMAITRGFKRMEYHTYADFIVFNIGRLGLTVLALSLGWGVLGAVVAFVVAQTLEVALLIYFLNRLFSIRRPLRTAQRPVRKLLSFSLPVCLSQLLDQLSANFQITLLGIWATMAAVGIFNAALRIQMVGTMFLMAIQMVAMPIISSLFSQDKHTELNRLYQTLTRWSLSFVLPFFSTVLLFAKPTLNIFGKEFEAGASALIIVCIGTFVNAGTGICGAMVVMTGHSRLEFVNSLISLTVTVSLDLLLIPVWGANGAAVAFAISVSIVNIARLYQVYRLHKLWPYNRTFFKPLAAGATTLVAGILINHLIPARQNLLYLILDVAALWSIFVASIILLGLSEEDRDILFRTQRRLSAALARH